MVTEQLCMTDSAWCPVAVRSSAAGKLELWYLIIQNEHTYARTYVRMHANLISMTGSIFPAYLENLLSIWWVDVTIIAQWCVLYSILLWLCVQRIDDDMECVRAGWYIHLSQSRHWAHYFKTVVHIMVTYLDYGSTKTFFFLQALYWLLDGWISPLHTKYHKPAG